MYHYCQENLYYSTCLYLFNSYFNQKIYLVMLGLAHVKKKCKSQKLLLYCFTYYDECMSVAC